MLCFLEVLGVLTGCKTSIDNFFLINAVSNHWIGLLSSLESTSKRTTARRCVISGAMHSVRKWCKKLVKFNAKKIFFFFGHFNFKRNRKQTAVTDIREFKMYDATVAKTSLKIAV